jgi:hypothetical protein
MIEEWKPQTFDLVLSVIVAIGFPFIAQLLYSITGALIPMVIYYGIAWGISKWRRGSTGYFTKFNGKPPIAFYLNLGIIIMSLMFAYSARIVVMNINIIGVIFTALLWASINASSEQILWIYIFEAWDLYSSRITENEKKLLYSIIGFILFTTFVGLIHVMFWVDFLHVVDSQKISGIIFVFLTTLSGYLHIVVWRKSNQMIYTFIPHFILNLFPLFWTGFSIIPYLLI